MKFIDLRKQEKQTVLFVQEVTDDDAEVLEAIGFEHPYDESEQFIDCEKWIRTE